MPTTLPEDSPLRVFAAHGVLLKNNGSGQSVGDCPFCGKEQKFYVANDTGLWKCFTCQDGNPLSFLRKLHETFKESTTREQYYELARERKYLTIDGLTQYEFAFSHLRNEWCVPGFYGEGDNRNQLKQLYRWTDYGMKEGKRRLNATPQFAHCLYGIREFNPAKSDVYVCEGPWDAIAIEETLKIARLNSDGTFELTVGGSSLFDNVNVIALPSTTTLNEHWLSLLSGKRVYLLLDNDHPRVIKDKNGNEHKSEPGSWQAYKRIVQKIKEHRIDVQSLFYLHWGKGCQENSYNPGLKSGYDVRDLLSEGYTKSLFDAEKASERIAILQARVGNLTKFYPLIEPVPREWTGDDSVGGNKSSSKKKKGTEELKLIPCSSWKDLIAEWDKAVVMHDGLEKTLSAMLACITSIMCPDTQVWLRVISEPSSGKSILCDAICTNKRWVTMQSNIRGFFSGMRPTKKQAKEGIEDLGLLSEINGKAFVTKDADPILQQADRPRIMAEARDLFDGKTATHFRTMGYTEHPIIRTVWILCGTPRVRDIDENDLGGRFIDCSILHHSDVKLRTAICRSAIKAMRKSMTRRVDLKKLESMDSPEMLRAKQMTGGYIEHLCNNGKRLMEEMDKEWGDTERAEEFDKTIEALASFTAKMRTRPGKDDEFITEELPARLGQQFARLAIAMSVVLNEPEPSHKVMRRIAEMAYDTSQGSVFTLTWYLYNYPKGETGWQLWKLVKRHERDYHNLLRFLVRLRAFDCSDPSMYTFKGIGSARFTLSQDLRRVCDNVFPYMEHIL